MASRGTMGSVQGVLYPGGGRGARGFDLHRLGGGAVLSERRRELGPGTRSARTVVLCCGRGVVLFSAGAGKMACAVACPVGQGPGRAARRAGCTVPCMLMCGASRVRACVRGNARAGRGVSGRRRARAGQGHSAAYEGSGRQGSIGRAWRC
jgi:hypothetical protein